MIAKELAESTAATLTPQDSLLRAFELFGDSGLPELPVLDEETQTRVVGMLSRQAAMDADQQGISTWPADSAPK